MFFDHGAGHDQGVGVAGRTRRTGRRTGERSKTSVPVTISSASQPLHPPALTCRSLSDRPKSFASSPVQRPTGGGPSPGPRTSASRSMAESRWSREKLNFLRAGRRALGAEEAAAHVEAGARRCRSAARPWGRRFRSARTPRTRPGRKHGKPPETLGDRLLARFREAARCGAPGKVASSGSGTFVRCSHRSWPA